MSLSCIVLVALTGANNLLSIGHGDWPVESLHERFADERTWGHMEPTCSSCTSASNCRPSLYVMHFCLMPEALIL
jgi:hypothetical protein